MKVFYSFLLLVALALTACNNEQDSVSMLKLADDTSTSFVIDAVDNLEATIKFTADASWTASVNEVTAKKSDKTVTWLMLSEYSGGAGEHAITVSLTKNYSGASRKAEIRIVCGESIVTINVEQTAETVAGETVKRIKEMQYEQQYYSEMIDNPQLVFGKSVAVLSYDEDGRLSRVNVTEDENREMEFIFDYNVLGKINISTVYADSVQSGTNAVITLDEKGYVVKVQAEENGQSGLSDIVSFGYTEDGRLENIKISGESDDEVLQLSYEDGYLTKIKDEIGSESDEILFDIPTFYSNKYPNNGMIDMFAFTGMADGFDYVFWLGKTGKTSDYILEKVINLRSVSDESIAQSGMVPVSEYEVGDVISTYSSTSTKLDDYSTVTCEYDSENNLSKLTKALKYEVVKYTYHQVVTDEKATIDNMDFYRTKTQLVGKESVDEGFDYDVYTFKY